MDAPFDPTYLKDEKFAVDQPVCRKEDPALLRGEGRYTDDLNCPGQLYGVMVRRRMAHGAAGGAGRLYTRSASGRNHAGNL